MTECCRLLHPTPVMLYRVQVFVFFFDSFLLRSNRSGGENALSIFTCLYSDPDLWRPPTPNNSLRLERASCCHILQHAKGQGTKCQLAASCHLAFSNAAATNAEQRPTGRVYRGIVQDPGLFGVRP